MECTGIYFKGRQNVSLFDKGNVTKFSQMVTLTLQRRKSCKCETCQMIVKDVLPQWAPDIPLFTGEQDFELQYEINNGEVSLEFVEVV
jgi:hypothetical protein